MMKAVILATLVLLAVPTALVDHAAASTCAPGDDPRICHADGCVDESPCITVKCYSPWTMWACQQWICAERLYENCVSYCLGGHDDVCVRR